MFFEVLYEPSPSTPYFRYSSDENAAPWRFRLRPNGGRCKIGRLPPKQGNKEAENGANLRHFGRRNGGEGADGGNGGEIAGERREGREEKRARIGIRMGRVMGGKSAKTISHR